MDNHRAMDSVMKNPHLLNIIGSGLTIPEIAVGSSTSRGFQGIETRLKYDKCHDCTSHKRKSSSERFEGMERLVNRAINVKDAGELIRRYPTRCQFDLICSIIDCVYIQLREEIVDFLLEGVADLRPMQYILDHGGNHVENLVSYYRLVRKGIPPAIIIALFDKGVTFYDMRMRYQVLQYMEPGFLLETVAFVDDKTVAMKVILPWVATFFSGGDRWKRQNSRPYMNPPRGTPREDTSNTQLKKENLAEEQMRDLYELIEMQNDSSETESD